MSKIPGGTESARPLWVKNDRRWSRDFRFYPETDQIAVPH
jgi:hypothetical protein